MVSVASRLCFLVLASVPCTGPVQAAYDPVFADGYECRSWYADADADGFGDPATGTFSCVAPPAQVPRADDCDDTNAAINPLGIDRPDASYVDANCDGFDGDADRAIHVSTVGTDTPTCGPRAAPCATVAYAIGRRSATRPDLYIRQGIHAGPVIVPALAGAVSSGLYGGFDTQWVRAPGVVTRIEGGALATLDGGTGGVFVDAATVVLGDLEVEAPNAVGTSGGYGRASVGVVARNANLTIWGCRIRAGRGSNGAAGAPGVAVPGVAPIGDDGSDAIARGGCNATFGGLGGDGSSNACPSGTSTSGGNGGRGGAADTSCGTLPNPAATAGIGGLSATIVSAPAGTGGSGGTGTVLCGSPGSGNPGVPGTPGTGGAGGSGGAVVGGNWLSAAGQSGSSGGNGGGGGGGGGSGGCDLGGNTAGAGGGGGGAGGCASIQAGFGGFGGGASIAVLLTSTTANLSASVLVTAGGGNGGNGGAGAAGQTGGAGGRGGLAVNSASPGGTGGDGGAGGPSGGGGGGAGGPSYGIVRSGGSLVTTGLSYQLGIGGGGGAGGAAAAGGNPGQTGIPGVSAPNPP